MSSRSNHQRAVEIDRIAKLLMETWAKAEPDHGVTKHPVSYIATFADMARAVVDDFETRSADVTAALEDACCVLEANTDKAYRRETARALRVRAGRTTS